MVGQALIVAPDMLFHGVLLVMVYSIVIDKMMAQGDAQIQLQIVSEKSDEIRQAILQDVDRGVLGFGFFGKRRGCCI